jgi:hypothetical protein
MTVHHVLVPLDLSTYAEQALDYAIALAQKLQARVTSWGADALRRTCWRLTITVETKRSGDG